MCEEQDRKRLLEDKKALKEAIKARKVLALEDDAEIVRLERHLEWLENHLKKGEQK